MENVVIAELMLELDFTPAEIAAELKRRGDRVIHRLISESAEGMILTAREKKIVEMLRASTHPHLYDVLVSVIELSHGYDSGSNDKVSSISGRKTTPKEVKDDI